MKNNMRLRTALKHDFSQSPQAHIPRAAFDRSHVHKTTFDAGLLIPIYVDEALPGDTFNMKMTAFARVATPIFPIMDNLFMDTHFFFIPNRLLWTNWERFNGAQDNPDDSTDFILPIVTAVTGVPSGSIYDYMGIPTGVNDIEFNTLPLRAYMLVWNTWFRDQNMQDSVVVPLGDGPDDLVDFYLLRRGKRYDYFTSCLPFPQKGPSVELPLGTTAPVISDGQPLLLSPSSTLSPTSHQVFANDASKWFIYDIAQQNNLNAYYANQGLVADLSTATAATINQLRLAFQTQRMYERDARGGTRYIEIIRSHFGVISPDARLQRPEYLGGGSSIVNFAPIAQTSATGATGTPQGNLSAFGTVSMLNHGFNYSFQEHGIVLGLVSVRSDYTYQQGMNRMWSRSTRFDFYWPALSHIGEQAVLNREIYTQGNSVLDPGDGEPVDAHVFGYQEAFADYRYKPAIVTGLFRSDAAGTLDSWHLAQDFGNLPVLDDGFISENPPMARIKAVTTEPDFIFDSFFSLKCARPMPLYSVPGMIDHF